MLQRKNALFFRTEFGALVGSILTSIIKTCVEADENPLDYLVALQEHSISVRNDPKSLVALELQGSDHSLNKKRLRNNTVIALASSPVPTQHEPDCRSISGFEVVWQPMESTDFPNRTATT